MTIKEQYRANIIAEWDFRKGTLLDQGTNSHDGTAGGSPIWNNSNRGRVFTGTGSEYVQVTDHADFDFPDATTDKTFVIWARFVDASGNNGLFGKNDGSLGNDNGYYLTVNGNDLLFVYNNGDPGSETGGTTSNPISNHIWYHLVASIDRTNTTGKLFIDGIEVKDWSITKTGSWSKAVNLIFGGLTNAFWNINGEMKDAIVFDVALTPQEVSALYEESIKEAHLDVIPEKTILPEGDFSDSNLVAGWDMNVRGGTATDISGNGNDGTLNGSIVVIDGINGKAMQLSSSEYIDTGDAFQSTMRGSFSIELWIKPDDGQPAADEHLLGTRNAASEDWVYVALDTSGAVDFYYESNNNGKTARTNSVIFPDGDTGWTHVVAVADSTVGGVGGMVIYVNGVLQTLDGVLDGDTSGITFADWTSSDNIFVGASNNNGSMTNGTNGLIDSVKFYNSALTATDVLNKYQENHPRLGYYADGKDWNVSTANVSAGELENSSWQVISGDWKVEDSDGGTKQIDCISSGDLSIPSNQAFGTWEWEMRKGGETTTPVVRFIVSGTTSGVNEYLVYYSITEEIATAKYVASGYTEFTTSAASLISLSTWYSIKLVRNGGTFSLYLDGTLVTATGGTSNPKTGETDHVVVQNIVLSLGTSDAIRNFRFSPVVQ